MIWKLIPVVGKLAARLAAFFSIWLWARKDMESEQLKDENEILRKNAGMPDAAIADKLRERAKAKDSH